MKRLVFVLAIIAGFGMVSLHAADFWKTKEFTDWSQKDIKKMMTNSPWARSVTLAMGGGYNYGGTNMPRTGGMGGGGGMGGAGGMGGPSGGMGGGGGSMGPRGTMGGPRMPQTRKVYVRWISALPIRQAMARNAYGDEMTSPKALKLLNLKDNRYIIGVSELPKRMMDHDQQHLKEKAFLKIKGKEPLPASEVQVRPYNDNTAELIFFFPRGSGAEEYVTADAKNVEFILDLPRSDVKRKFKLKDMTYKGKLEL